MIELGLACARVLFTDRRGGVSDPPYDGLNLADHVGDRPESVAENARRLAAAVGLPDPDGWVRPAHVHGAQVLRVPHGGPVPGARPAADGAASAVPGVTLVALGADCAPVALANDGAACALHAGWRGIEAGVIEAGVEAVRALGPGRVRAQIGPTVCAQHYEFGADLLETLVARLGPEVAARAQDGRPAFDLRSAIRGALGRAGVTEVGDVGICTVESAEHFSHRRDGVTGRQAVIVVPEGLGRGG